MAIALEVNYGATVEKLSSHNDDGFVLRRFSVVSLARDRVFLSLRKTRVDKIDHTHPDACVSDMEYNSVEQLSSGTIVRGYVKAVTRVGVFVR